MPLTNKSTMKTEKSKKYSKAFEKELEITKKIINKFDEIIEINQESIDDYDKEFNKTD